MALLDCRDTRISLWQEAGTHHSPGFVALEGGEYLFGDAARQQSRLRPRDTSSRFWWQLSTQPLKPSLGAARHTADLVHSHLRHVHESAGAPEALTLAVPDAMPREQLSLLLGVAQACAFEVSGLVSRSVLLASTHPSLKAHPRIIHVESQLNQTILNELVNEGDSVHLLRSTPLPACGLMALQERCVSAIASAFIQQTRFDPRRSADSEQQLYNELPDILGALIERGEASVDIAGHRCRVTAAGLAGVAERLLNGLASALDEGLPLIMDPELMQLPGLDPIRNKVTALKERALWDAWQIQQEALRNDGEDVHLIDRLSLQAPESASPPASPSENKVASPDSTPVASTNDASPSAEAERATHVLVGTRAIPLRGDRVSLGSGFSLQSQGGAWTLHGDGGLINGIPSNPQQSLRLGDTLSLGAAGHGRLIEVVD